MAKIIVTQRNSGNQILVDVESKFEKDHGGVWVVAPGNQWIGYITENIEEIQKRINEAEAQSTNKKLDEILENQIKILEKLSDMDREVISCEEF